ncbi:PhzF family phenazine biosynthesis protein [Pseudonocardiaceae bacterium YIM PH 21723]|nr:PhzF family phenazine biosynthesis protein [Pseudonocardiaceae bacterium YIM PH 21723]
MRYWLVDSFTDTPFKGNPAAVVPLEAPASDDWMQAVAAEFNLSETAFLLGDELRWFTPASEVDLCGHATLAAAHVLGGGTHAFKTRSGTLNCENAGEWIHMDFPADPPADSAADLTAALPGTAPEFVGRGVSDVIAVLSDAAEVRAISPDAAGVAALGSRGLIVTAPGDRPDLDMVSRCFFPDVGVFEDPVTGSAHCTLASYWAGRLGKTTLVGEQASRRGGIVRMEVRGDRVGLSGQAVTVATGELHAPG